MTWWQAALWGLAGGGCASLLSLAAAVKAAGYTWPWRKGKGDLAPRLFVLGIGLVLGAVVSAAAHDQISGAWPALLFGIGAPATIRGVLSGVEVEPKRQRSRQQPTARRTPSRPSRSVTERSARDDVS